MRPFVRSWSQFLLLSLFLHAGAFVAWIIHPNETHSGQKMRPATAHSSRVLYTSVSRQLIQTPPLVKSIAPKKAQPLNTPTEFHVQQEALSSVAQNNLPAVSDAVKSDIKYKYFSEIVHKIHRHKQYPRKAFALHQEGTVVVRLKLGREGNILDLMVVEPCPFENLNHAALDTISSIEKFPKIPHELGEEEMIFRIPIEYKINF